MLACWKTSAYDPAPMPYPLRLSTGVHRPIWPISSENIMNSNIIVISVKSVTYIYIYVYISGFKSRPRHTEEPRLNGVPVVAIQSGLIGHQALASVLEACPTGLGAWDACEVRGMVLIHRLSGENPL